MSPRPQFLMWIVLVILVACKQDDFKFDFSSSKTPTSVLIPGISQASYTQNRQVQMQLSTSDPYQMTFFVNKSCVYKQAESWESFSENKTIELPNEDGVYEIAVMFRNKDHFPSECKKLKVVLDRVGPVMAQVNVPNRASTLTATPPFSFPAAKDWLSPIKKYQARIVDGANSEVQGWTDIAATPEALQSLTVNLSAGYTYYIELRAQDEALNFGTAVRSKVFYAGLEINLTMVNGFGNTVTCSPTCGLTSSVTKMQVTLNFPISEDLSVQFQTEDFTAYDGLDYFKVDETKQLISGASSVSFLLNVRDTYQPGSRTFKINIKTPISEETVVRSIYNHPLIPQDFQAKSVQPLFESFHLGQGQSCALGSDKAVYCFGFNPLSSSSPYGKKMLNLTNVKQVEMGFKFGCALQEDGQVKCWDVFTFGTYMAVSTSSDPQDLPGFSNVSQFSVAKSTTNSTICAVHSDGTIRCAGKNVDYLLGNGTTNASTTADLVLGFSQVGVDPVATKVVMGTHVACALTAAGTVYCWGYNGTKQAGHPSDAYVMVPTQVPGLSSVVNLWAGARSLCAKTSADRIFCWGDNSSAQLAQPLTVVSSEIPLEIPGFTGVVSMSLGVDANCALRDIAGVIKAFCWGKATSTGLGENYYRVISTPQETTLGPGTFKDLAVSPMHDAVCAVKSDFKAYCRGRSNDASNILTSNELGLAKYDTISWWGLRSAYPVNTPLLYEAEDISAHSLTLCMWNKAKKPLCHGFNALSGAYMTRNGMHAKLPTAFVDVPVSNIDITATEYGEVQCYVDLDKKVWCRGDNSYGALGDGTLISRDTYAQVSGISNIKMVVTGWTHTCALSYQSEIYCWGTGANGQLGTALASPYRTLTPLLMTNLPAGTINKIEAGSNHNCMLMDAGPIYCWGRGGQGRLGNGTTTDSATPVKISSTANFKDLSVSANMACAVTDFGALYCWGNNAEGALGDGTIVEKHVPTQVQTSTNDTFVQVDTAFIASCAVTTNGEVFCWGWQNSAGQLGNGTLSPSLLPVKVRNIQGGAAKVALMQYRSTSGSSWSACALIKLNGKPQDVKCWGWVYGSNVALLHSGTMDVKPMLIDQTSN